MKYRLIASVALVLLTSAVPVFQFQPAEALGLNNRSLELGTSAPSVTTTYSFQFDITFNSNLGSIYFEFCSNSPIPDDVCTPPADFDISSATLTDQTGETGFSIDPGVTDNTLLLTRAPAIATPQTVTYEFTGVANPSTPNTTNYVRLSTYSTDDGSGAVVEDGGIAFAINDDFSITAFVPPFLQFCVGLTISANDCSTATGNLINFGILESAAPAVATSQMAGATNGADGLAITVLGTTMTSGVHTIDALSTRDNSVPGTSQFGINLRNNSVPNVGSDVSGPGTTNPVGDYNVVNEFAFNSGDTVASSPLPTDFDTLTVSYLVNVDPDQEPGVYTATMTYVATATF